MLDVLALVIMVGCLVAMFGVIAGLDRL